MQTNNPEATQDSSNKQAQNTGRWKLLAVVAVCAFPIIASYFTYYIIKPTGRNNYGALIDPRLHPIPEAQLHVTQLDGEAAPLAQFKGKWVMLQTGPSDCQAACKKLLFEMQQLRLMQGKERERIERVWLVTDAQPLDTLVMREFDGTSMLRVNGDALKAWLPVEPGGQAADHLYLIDPLGNLMMRFPKDADPSKVKKDIAKLLKASAIG
ncbi:MULTISPECIES: cytochrome C oxidase subunit I [unclassified Janthinobacterium]|uniref:SCO family protein n=1 Tax=unclassified Janthinobacterium TaxID=2610881 RepID=UPI000882E4D1|nr:MULTISPECIES: cytochrome C oxidase subunit I [unclassified Janthinobacterium]SDA83305.1 Cytochrome oxidase Cu insertion factor, SCO1/SenC/PrrC family [Janthinobacterium sp. 551a]SFB10199.1 Cytochrome oxidase Cu insertion factor, SCO1/SenC/PrrC family [Janthinobacterium sp. 344]